MLPIPEDYLGHTAALFTSVLWTFTSMFFTAGGRRLGSSIVNAVRIPIAVALLATTHFILTGRWWPDLLPLQVLYLALSGFIGLSIGDQALFTAFVDIGPRLSMLLMTTSPIFAAAFGFAFLGESLSPLGMLGIVITISGVAWVVLERPKTEIGKHPPHRLRGIILAVVGAACQAGGLLLSKQGIGHGWLESDQHINPQAATLVRMSFAFLGVLPIFVASRLMQRRDRAAGRADRRIGSKRVGYAFVVCGAMVGPYLGVWMSLVACDLAPLGIAQTLCSLSPIFILPFAVVIYREPISPRAAIGAVIAVSGAAMLFLTS
jgi:drug/metabolite transporter (DMT)-like permease